MHYPSSTDQETLLPYLIHATKAAQNATCERSKCGSIIVQGEEIIGTGWNTPPHDEEGQRRCTCAKDSYHRKVTDRTCCVHAEQRAIMDALRNNPNKIIGSTLYFVRLDENGQPKHSGKPYCTICSKMALDVGIAEFVLWHEHGLCFYPTDEYNTLSYQYDEEGN